MIQNTIKLSLLFIVLLLVQNVDLTLIKSLKSSLNNQIKNIDITDSNSFSGDSWFLMRNIYTDLCLTWNSNKSVEQVTCNKKKSNQLWKITKVNLKEGTWINFSNVNGEFLEYQGEESKINNMYLISPRKQPESQNFFAVKVDSGFSLQNESGKKCLAPKNLDEKGMIEQTRCCGTLRTAWRFEKVDDVKISSQATK
jgi:hypothetical protein